MRNPFLFLVTYVRALTHIFSFKPHITWAHHPLPYLFFKLFLFRSKNILSFHGPCIEELRSNKAHRFKIFLYFILTRLSSFKAIIHFNTDFIGSCVESGTISSFSYHKIVTPVLVYPPYYLTSSSLKKENVIQDYNGVNYYLSTKTLIVVPRRIEPRTGVLRLIKLIEANRNILDPKYLFVFTGAGPDFDRIKHVADNCSNIVLTGFVAQSLLLDLISNAASVIIPSVAAEGYCLPARIAYLFGVPVVSTGIGGLPVAYPMSGPGHYLFNLDSFDSLLSRLQVSVSLKLPNSLVKERQALALKEYVTNTNSYPILVFYIFHLLY